MENGYVSSRASTWNTVTMVHLPVPKTSMPTAVNDSRSSRATGGEGRPFSRESCFSYPDLTSCPCTELQLRPGGNIAKKLTVMSRHHHRRLCYSKGLGEFID